MEADCSCWYLGYTFNIGGKTDNTKIIHIDIEPEEIGRNYPTDIGVVADAKTVVSVLTRVAKEMYPEGIARDVKKAEIAAFRASFKKSNREMAKSSAFAMMPERILADPDLASGRYGARKIWRQLHREGWDIAR